MIFCSRASLWGVCSCMDQTLLWSTSGSTSNIPSATQDSQEWTQFHLLPDCWGGVGSLFLNMMKTEVLLTPLSCITSAIIRNFQKRRSQAARDKWLHGLTFSLFPVSWWGGRNDSRACVFESVTDKKELVHLWRISPLGTVKAHGAGEAPSSGCPCDWKFRGQMLEGMMLTLVFRCIPDWDEPSPWLPGLLSEAPHTWVNLWSDAVYAKLGS